MIENLVVSNMVFDAGVTGEYGFAIVGNAGGGATLRNLTAAGVFGAADKASTHNIAGIVVRLSPGATADVATTVDSCTNNATIYGGYTKLGGICAIAQQQTGFSAGKVVFNNCANNGTLVCKRTAADVTGNAGIVGYVATSNVELTGCYGNGVITNSDGANTNCDGALVGTQYTGYTLKDNGGNSAPANKKMIATYGNQANVTGFQYATVANGVATTVTTLAKDTTYLLEGNVAASATPVFTLAAAGDTFKVDTALGYTFDGTVAVDTTTLVLTEATDGSTKTYTATAGVASVNDFAYATFAEAVAAVDSAPEGYQYVTLLANASTTFSDVGSIAVKLNGHELTMDYGSFAGSSSYDSSTGITTYTAVQAVAKIGDTKYATLAEAVEDFEDGDVIEFLEDFENLTENTVVFTKEAVFKFAYNANYGETFQRMKAGAMFTMVPTFPTEQEPYFIYTVTAKSGDVELYRAGSLVGIYQTVSSAYGDAANGDSLTIKLSDNFSVDTWANGEKAFDTITFQNKTESALTVTTYTTPGSGVYYYMKAANWVAPADVTLKLYTQTVTSINAGTLNVPAGVTLTSTDGTAFNGVSSLTGTGRVTINGTVSSATPSPALQLLCQNQAWTGTLEMSNVDISGAVNLTVFGNANSTVCFNNAGCALTANNVNAHAIGTLEIGPYGFDLIGNYSAGVFTLPCAVKGTGTFKVSAKNSDYGTDKKDVKFTGDVSGFTGNITFDNDANARVVFGTGTYLSAAAAKCIIVTAGTEMALPAAATWTAPTGIIVNGGLDVWGTLDVPASNLYGSGVVKFHDSAKAVRAADSWTGTYRIDWAVPAGAFVIGDYGRKAEGTIEIMQDINGAYPATAASGGTSPSIVPTVKLSANWTINDGWGTTTTFAKLTGSGNLTVNGKTSTGTADVPYTITRLEGYTGTLGGVRGKFKIGTIVAAEEPVAGTKLVKLASSTRAFTDLDQTVVVYNNATVEGITLEQKDDGIYVAEPPASDLDPSSNEPVEIVADSAAAATNAVQLVTPAGVDPADYKNLFDFAVTEVVPGEKYEVSIAGIKEEKVAEVNENAVESLVAAVESEDTTVTVDVPAGLYYKITTYNTLGGAVVDFETGLSDGTGTTPVDKPESTTQGFIKVELSTVPFN